MTRLWRLADISEGDEYPWDGYTWLAAGETAEDAMRAVVLRVKRDNERWAGIDIDPDPIPVAMLAAPLAMPDGATQLGDSRSDIGESFEDMFDYEHAVRVRL